MFRPAPAPASAPAPSAPLTRAEMLARPVLCLRSAVVPFCVEERTQTIYVLLGRSAHVPGRVRGLGCWSDLGGRGLPKDHGDPAAIAAREFVEEGLGSVRLDRNGWLPPPHKYEAYVLKDLKEGKYFVRLEMRYHHPPGDGLGDPPEEEEEEKEEEEHVHDVTSEVFFLKQIPFDPEITTRFTRFREFILTKRRQVEEEQEEEKKAPTPAPAPTPPLSFIRAMELRRLEKHPALLTGPNDCLEKDELRWFSLDFLMDIMQSNGGVLRGVRLRPQFCLALSLLINELNQVS